MLNLRKNIQIINWDLKIRWKDMIRYPQMHDYCLIGNILPKTFSMVTLTVISCYTKHAKGSYNLALRCYLSKIVNYNVWVKSTRAFLIICCCLLKIAIIISWWSVSCYLLKIAHFNWSVICCDLLKIANYNHLVITVLSTENS